MAGASSTYGADRAIDSFARVIGKTNLVVVANMVWIITGTIGVTHGRTHATEAGLSKFTEHIIAGLAGTSIGSHGRNDTCVTYLIAHTIVAICTRGMTPILVANHATRTRHRTIIFGTNP